MPHLTIEYSANLANNAEMTDLCRELAHCIDTQRDGDRKVFPTGGIRVRALKSEACCIADGSIEDAAFVHLNFRIAAGRSDAVLKATAAVLMDVVKRHFAEAYRTRGFAASLEVNEFGKFGTLKYNNLHQRLAEHAGPEGMHRAG
ncbi:MAG: 5-carboxymethyl-2-hydroxymuconate Delta-isomerase [Gammaproteobacteria bacterium]